MKSKVYVVLLAGGKGTRLWPLSTQDFSKSFVGIGGSKPLILDTMKRLDGFVGVKNILVVVDKAQAGLAKSILRQIPRRNILVEPFGRSTASAVGLASSVLNGDDIMVVLPTDALIKGDSAFRNTVKKAVLSAEEGGEALFCIGIKPRDASTAYGYIKLKPAKGRILKVDKFIEKPSKKNAQKFLKNANYAWNAGIFVFRVGNILNAMKRHAPLLYRQVNRMKKNKKNKLSAYRKMKNISIDYQIMEKAKNLYCVKGDFSWIDLGNWIRLAESIRSDASGNIGYGRVSFLDTRDSIAYNTEKKKLGVIGLRGVIAANTKNGMLVCSKDDAEKVKKLTEERRRNK